MSLTHPMGKQTVIHTYNEILVGSNFLITAEPHENTNTPEMHHAK